MENRLSISIIMPVYNGASTVVESLKSLLVQSEKFDELVIVNDASTDDSKKIAEQYLAGKIDHQIIDHKMNQGLAKSYNEAIKLAQGDLIVTMHQDVILMENALKDLIVPFSNKDVVVTGHRVVFSQEIWNKFNFWQKCFFARFAGKETSGINGQFDCFRKIALEKVGFFDGVKFRSAGEDGDIVSKLGKIGKIVITDARIIHLQNLDPKFGYKDIIYKQKQHSEARGALLAQGRIKGLMPISRTFFREIILLSLFIPFLNYISLILIVIYSFVYTKIVFWEEYKNPRILVLPLFNLYLLLIGFFYSWKGFIYGKQRI
jgi:glycosyltransferase involved in cell wall biosynthesis